MKRIPNNVIKIAPLVIFVALFAWLAVAVSKRPVGTANDRKLQVVAGENFWGSLASQLGGAHVAVRSVVSDPNADPHEYETSNADARAVATANYVILNGAGYDGWGDKLVAANPHAGRKTLNVADLLGKKAGDNPHFWYSPAYVNRAVVQMERDFAALDPADKQYFAQQLVTLQASLAKYQNHITAIKQEFGGTKVAATEDVFDYLADATGLTVISPTAFIQAVAEGNDPPAASVATFQQQLREKQAAVLVYNRQTITPLTTGMQNLAGDESIPTVAVTETIQPPNTPFQDWMDAQLTVLETSLRMTKDGR
ncbi:MAG TPA: zinc ABC transporter substrate-binding protein [Candidatus Saccharimonadales bacterium]|nr:zinc ABC transporter substrate-binding protein [Candidatus Saccharimonadales bacterium]